MKKALALLLLFTLHCAFSQDNSKADSLIKVLSKTKDIEEKSKLMLRVANAYTIDSDKGIAWYNKQLAFAIKNDLSTATALNAIGVYYLNRQEYDNALKSLLRALEDAKKHEEFHMMGSIYTHIAVIFAEQKNFKRALYYDAKALEIRREINDVTGIADSYNSTGVNYSEMGHDDKALPYYKKALSIYIEKHDTIRIAYTYFNIGYSTQDLLERASYMEKSKELYDKVDPLFNMAVSNMCNLAETYFYISKDAALCAKANSTQQAMLKKAEDLLNQAIVFGKKEEMHMNLMFSYEVLAKIKETQNKPAEALDYTRKMYALKDTIFSQEQKNNIATTESAAQIALRDKQLELNRVTLKTRERQFWMLFTGILLFTGLVVILFLQASARKAQNRKLEKLNSELDAANKTKARLFGIINHDLRGPVASLINFLHLQKNNMLDEAKKQELEAKTMTSANGLLQSMEDLLLWSKGQMEHFRPDIKPVSAQSLFNDIQALYTGLPVTFSNPENIIFNSDENYLKTILRNLTANAIKAVANTPHPQIEWKAFNENGHHYLSITDNGPGAATETFSALYGNTTDIGIKNGFGLHLVRELATAINCKTEVTTGDSGTTITLKIK
jgi:signal transduction histidine kinase